MAIVTGVLSGYDRLPLYNRSPVIEFRASGNATKDFGSVLYATRVITSTPDPANGQWSVDLEDTDHLVPATHYDVAIKWLDLDGNFISVDYLDGRLYVPTGGGRFYDLFRAGGNPLMVWIDSGAPTPPPGAVGGDLVFDPITNNLYQVS